MSRNVLNANARLTRNARFVCFAYILWEMDVIRAMSVMRVLRVMDVMRVLRVCHAMCAMLMRV